MYSLVLPMIEKIQVSLDRTVELAVNKSNSCMYKDICLEYFLSQTKLLALFFTKQKKPFKLHIGYYTMCAKENTMSLHRFFFLLCQFVAN